MLKQIVKITAFLPTLFLMVLTGYSQNVTEPQNRPADWSKNYRPFQIAGNLYYVGTEELACYLLTTSQGNILINTGLASSAEMINANIETLGFKLSDTKILLTTQAHYDHMGAMAKIKKLTGAAFMIEEKDAPVAEDGGKSDYAFGSDESSFQPIKPDRLLHDKDTITLGNMRLVILHHPGHTKGSASYLFDVRDRNRSYKVLIANMPTIVTEKKFTDLPSYPDIAKDYAYTLANMKNLQFDIWLTSHASQFGLHAKHKPGNAYDPKAFIDRKGYDDEIAGLETEFSKRIAKD